MANTNLVTTTPTRFTVIRPELLPQMQLLQPIDTELLISTRMAKYKALWASYDPPNAMQYDVERLEFDPIRIQAELAAYFELLVRDRVNQGVRGVTLAFSIGSDIDGIGSRYPYGVPRLPGESDATYKLRLWNSPSIFSLNGPGQGVFESYVFWALSAPMPEGQRKIRHAAALTKRGTGMVQVVILSENEVQQTPAHWVFSNDRLTMNWRPQYVPTPTKEQISAVYQFLTDKRYARKGLTDWVNVVGPKVFHAEIKAKIWLFPGVDKDALMMEVGQALVDLVEAIRWLGADLTKLSINGAMAQAGVYNAVLTSPAADVVVGQDGVVNVTNVELTYAGVGE